MSHRVIESTIQSFTRALSKALASEKTATLPGLLQSFDPRVRLIIVLALIIASTLCTRITVLLGFLVLATVVALASNVRIKTLVSRVWFVVLAFTGVIAIPALFVTPGTRIGATHITAQGLHAATLLVLRTETAVTFTTALVLSTRWNHLLRSLRALGLPAEIIAMLAMTHRYIFLLIETANQMFESRQSRIVSDLSGPESRRLFSRTGGVLLVKSIGLSEEVFHAMQARGFDGEVRVIDEPRMRAIDYLVLGSALLFAAAAAWVGR